MQIHKSMTDQQLFDELPNVPHILFRFQEQKLAFEVAQNFTLAKYHFAGTHIRIFYSSAAPQDGATIIIAGAIPPEQMLEAAEQATSQGGYISGAGFVGADSKDWLVTFDRVMELVEERPKDSECALLIPTRLQSRSKIIPATSKSAVPQSTKSPKAWWRFWG